MDWHELARRPLSYSEEGATKGPPPAGYHHITRSEILGHGREVFEAAANRIFAWEMHRGAGLTVVATGPAEVGNIAVVGLGPLSGACRVIYKVDEPDRRGFAYGTLQGHPESGEEYFGVRLDPTDGSVYGEIVGFSRPGRWWSKLGSLPAALLQRHITDRYLTALRTETP